MAEPDKTWIIESLKYSLQALAMPADVQPLLYPDYVEVADELALDFEDFYQAAVGNFSEIFSQESLIKMKELDDFLSELSEDKSCWSLLALQKDQRWNQIRAMAASLLELLNWPLSRPPYSFGGTYVPGGK